MVARAACETVGVDRRARLRDARLYFVADRGGIAARPRGRAGRRRRPLPAARQGRRPTTSCSRRRRDRARASAHAAGALFVAQRPPRPRGRRAAPTACTSARTTCRVARARALVGADAIVGLSTHSIAAGPARRCRSGADYIAVGPVHATPTKEGRPAIGVEPVTLRRRARRRCPWFAIGGIDAGERRRGGRGGRARGSSSCARSPSADDPEAAARALRAATARRARAAGRRGRARPAERAAPPPRRPPAGPTCAAATRAPRSATPRCAPSSSRSRPASGRRAARRAPLVAAAARRRQPRRASLAGVDVARRGAERRRRARSSPRVMLVAAWGMWHAALLGRARLRGAAGAHRRRLRRSVLLVASNLAARRRSASRSSAAAAGCSGSSSA